MRLETAPAGGVPRPWPPSWRPRSLVLRMAADLEGRLPWIAVPAMATSRLRWLLRQELVRPPALPWPERTRAWRHGFLTYSWIIGDLARRDLGEHVSDLTAVLAAGINGRHRHLLNDKLLFAGLMERFPDHAPRLLGLVLQGRLALAAGAAGPGDLDALAELLRLERGAILKPAGSSCGHGVWLLEHDGDGFLVDGRRADRPRIARLLAASDRQLLQERVRQHPYAEALHPGSANTLRILTMWDPAEDRPFVASVVQRIGTRASFPADNTSRGGLWCPVDAATGQLGPAIRCDRARGRREVLPVHPESGAVIAGANIPDLPTLVEGLLRVARALPFLPYVGWDVLVTPDGFRILEGNNAPELSHTGPLLRDERVRRFLRHHGLPVGRPPRRPSVVAGGAG